jgi:integrase
MTTFEKLAVVVPSDWISGPKQGQWTYTDYTAIPEDGHRYEVVNGVLYMAPAPNLGHQGIALEIAAYLRKFVQKPGLGRVFIAPADVELGYNNVVQPDVFDKQLLGETDVPHIHFHDLRHSAAMILLSMGGSCPILVYAVCLLCSILINNGD